MTLLQDIQNAAVDASSNLATLLRKCKLLAARLGSQQLEDWVLWESNGYPDGVPVPEYRIWSLEVRGHFAGPFGSGIRNAKIPLVSIPERVRKRYQRYECRQSIAGIETMLANATDGTLQVSTGDLALVLGRKIYRDQNCVEAWAEFGANQLIEVVNTVRNRILDFTLAVWKEEPNAGEPNASVGHKLEADKVTQIFNTTVYGGSANLVGTVTDSSVVFNITANDFGALEKVLAEQGVEKSDIAELKEALAEEPLAKPDGSFGSRVSSWIARMVKKAAEGTWDVGIAAAGNLLSQAISKYYGL
jgi:hypothetical protein